MRRELAILLALAAITLVVYWPVHQHEFLILDDLDYVAENHMVRQGPTLSGARWAFTTGHAANWHPLTWLSHMLDCRWFGLDAGAHLMVNVCLHALNALLLFGVLGSLGMGIWSRAVVAGLFAWHPLHVESVAWVAERKDVLSTLFWMLTMLAYLAYVRRPGWPRYLLALGLFALGLLAKPMLVTLRSSFFCWTGGPSAGWPEGPPTPRAAAGRRWCSKKFRSWC